MRKFLFLTVLLLLFFINSFSEWHPPQRIREIPVPNLPDIAIASFDALGPVIYYNPYLVRLHGPNFAMFTRAHEYGHHYLQHAQKRMFVKNPYIIFQYMRSQEIEADLFAVE